jgi:hypothetical protein
LNEHLETLAAPAGRRAAVPQLGRDRLHWLLKAILSSRPDELACDECFDVVDTFTEFVLAARDPTEGMPLVQDHLDRCPPCREEFQALLDAVQALSRSD